MPPHKLTRKPKPNTSELTTSNGNGNGSKQLAHKNTSSKNSKEIDLRAAAFAQYYLANGGNIAQAGIAAGYSPAYARTTLAVRFRSYPNSVLRQAVDQALNNQTEATQLQYKAAMTKVAEADSKLMETVAGLDGEALLRHAPRASKTADRIAKIAGYLQAEQAVPAHLTVNLQQFMGNVYQAPVTQIVQKTTEHETVIDVECETT